MTCDGVLPALPDGTVVQVEDDLYAAPSSRLLDRLRRIGDDVTGVLLVGHNPGLHDLAVSLAGEGDEELRAELAGAFPTGALASLVVPGSWAELAPGAATLRAFVVPRHLS
jgi:phosphohistidine phosphatase